MLGYLSLLFLQAPSASAREINQRMRQSCCRHLTSLPFAVISKLSRLLISTSCACIPVVQNRVTRGMRLRVGGLPLVFGFMRQAKWAVVLPVLAEKRTHVFCVECAVVPALLVHEVSANTHTITVGSV